MLFICKFGNREQGTGNREQGTGNREQGTGNREQGIGNTSTSLSNRVMGKKKLYPVGLSIR
ncbi:MAG: hypothetical protein AUK43_08670 [Oscillatoriales cyanobacterium CG2_30_40_61]|nr:MAG: hypothetical protein AUK43_08670 [Oscillatoriales cyanobacterium CG2_30_40_61]